MKAIYFDMDGTIYDLYGVEGWEPMLRNEDVTAYACGEPLYNMVELETVLAEFVALGITIGVITWSAMDGSKEYNKATRRVKREWIKENMPCVSEFHCVKYGTPKHQVANIKDSVLVDDNANVRAAWKNGDTVDATKNIIQELKKLLAQFENMC